MKKGKEKIHDSFEDKRSLLIVSFLCLLYFAYYHFSPTEDLLAKILPPLPLEVFGVLAGLVLIIQGIIWKKLKLFQPKWYFMPSVWILFIAEYILGLFVIAFLSWPAYTVISFFADPANKVIR